MMGKTVMMTMIICHLFKPPTEEELREQLDCARNVEEQINISRQLMALRPGLKIKLKPLAEVAVEKEKKENER